MRLHSVFCFECVCGQYIEMPEKEGQCPKCKWLIAIEWPARLDNDPAVPVAVLPKKEKAA